MLPDGQDTARDQPAPKGPFGDAHRIDVGAEQRQGSAKAASDRAPSTALRWSYLALRLLRLDLSRYHHHAQADDRQRRQRQHQSRARLAVHHDLPSGHPLKVNRRCDQLPVDPGRGRPEARPRQDRNPYLHGPGDVTSRHHHDATALTITLRPVGTPTASKVSLTSASPSNEYLVRPPSQPTSSIGRWSQVGSWRRTPDALWTSRRREVVAEITPGDDVP